VEKIKPLSLSCKNELQEVKKEQKNARDILKVPKYKTKERRH